ncbi:MAG: TIGR03960 family B12-binding radical SAM protein [Candidatus Omnitrophica bacterium]|nr:TIGR03960 family B12-binding radical SAM protein [Candidatus Omnitrophota bacterium]
MTTLFPTLGTRHSIPGTRYPVRPWLLTKPKLKPIIMTKLNEILNKIQKPGRYIGGETNSVRKEWKEGMVSVALSYPDTYEIGMSYLGLKILYHLLNESDGIICERVFAPWTDMENELKENGVPLYGLESRRSLAEFDIVGFSLSYELTYTNVLNMLSLSGIPVLSAERKENDPVVIAGGTCCSNPEPMSAFVDVFVIGDGEDILPAIINRYRELKKANARRQEMLRDLSRMKGVYVPSLYRAEYSNGVFDGLVPGEDGVPGEVRKITVPDLENAYYPVKQIVPLVKTVHDRIAVEIMRGCPNRCRFCQAMVVNRPVRMRSRSRIRELCAETYKNTGYSDIALLSLSSVNYPGLGELVEELAGDFSGKGVGLSVPSLRIAESFYELPGMLSAIKKTGLTFAPEAAGEGLRKAVGKDIDLDVLRRSADLAFRNGWRRLKLYFMMGFPGETDSEMEGIIGISRELSLLRKKVAKGAAEVRVSVNPFIPKPQTVFQRFGMAPRKELSRKRQKLKSSSSKKVKFDVSDIDRSILEASLSRGDRRMARVIHRAWKNGARMDGWDECFDAEAWNKAFGEEGIGVDHFASKSYALSERLPWGHIKPDIPEGYLEKELEQSGLSSSGR